MKLHDRVYRDLHYDPAKTVLGTVVATSAEFDHEVYEGEYVDVVWDDAPDTRETIEVSTLDRIATPHPCGCPEETATTRLATTNGAQCSSCGSRWDGEGTVFMLIEGPLNAAGYARLTHESAAHNYDRAYDQALGAQQHLTIVGKERAAAAAAVARHTPISDRDAVQRDRAEIRSLLDDLEKVAAPLNEARAALVDDLRAADDLLAELAETALQIRDSRDSSVGYKRFRSIVKALHPAIYDTNNWNPSGDWEAPFSEHFPIPHLALDYAADQAYIDGLADALVAYGQRFLPDLPEVAEGQFRVDMLDHTAGERHSWSLMVDPVARTAMFYDRHHQGAGDIIASLPEILKHACKVAWLHNGPTESEDY